MKIRTPQQFENDFFPGWDVNKTHASAATLKWQEKFLAAKKKVIERTKRRRFYIAPTLPQDSDG
jgi:hypothetical protein